ncbi:MAG: DNA-directed RNA polymerase subunit omega [Porcipelethomonas sp.]
MLRPAITQLISKNDSYYSLVIGIAKRAREIADELVEEKKTLEEKPVKTAVEEFANGKFRIIEAKDEEKKPEVTEEPQIAVPETSDNTISDL